MVITDYLENLYTAVYPYFSLSFLMVFVAMAYVLKDGVHLLLETITRRCISSKHYAVLVIGLALAILFYCMGFETDLLKLLVTYAVGTSVYDNVISLLKDLFEWLTSKIKAKRKDDGNE